MNPTKRSYEISHTPQILEINSIIAAGKSEFIHLYSIDDRKLSSVFQINSIKKIKEISVVPGMPEHVFILGNVSKTILNFFIY
jgi:hypothetical protein